MSRREIVGFAAVACVACCIGPILGTIGAVAALGAIATLFIGVAGLAIAAGAIGAFVVARRRRPRPCAATGETVAVELTRTNASGLARR